jgi:hypothetical protein
MIISDVIMIPKEEQYGGTLDFIDQSLKNFLVFIQYNIKNDKIIFQVMEQLGEFMRKYDINEFMVHIKHYNNEIKSFTYKDFNNIIKYLKPSTGTSITVHNIKHNIPLHQEMEEEQEGGAPKRNRKFKGPPILLSPEIRKSDLDKLMSPVSVVSQTELNKFYKNTKGGRKSRKGKKLTKKRKTRKN